METKFLNKKALEVFLVLLRTVIGWHFLYEGLIKITDPNWYRYLNGSSEISSRAWRQILKH